MIKDKSTHELLYILSQKGHCWYNETKCYRIFNELVDRIDDDERRNLSVALSHMYSCGEGPMELIDICKELMEKYKDD